MKILKSRSTYLKKSIYKYYIYIGSRYMTVLKSFHKVQRITVNLVAKYVVIPLSYFL